LISSIDREKETLKTPFFGAKQKRRGKERKKSGEGEKAEKRKEKKKRGYQDSPDGTKGRRERKTNMAQLFAWK
jgi:hypothetical protein